MAIDKAVDSTQLDADLTSVADAIRTKGGTSSSLTFPTGFVSAINAIPTGGGSENEDAIIMRTISGAYENSRVTSIGNHAFYNCGSLTTVSFPNCTTIGTSAFYGCKSLTTASFPSCTSISAYAFAFCAKLTTASFPACTKIESNAFIACPDLTTASFPVCTTIGSAAFSGCNELTTISFPVCTTIVSNAFKTCSGLTTASFPSCTSIANNAFRDCYKLISLYLMGSSVATLGTSVFPSTPIGGYSSIAMQYGSVFVPQSLLASYQAATNWASIASRIVGV